MDLKLDVSHMASSELWDQKALHMRTSVRDHMLSRALLQKKLNLKCTPCFSFLIIYLKKFLQFLLVYINCAN